MPINIVRLGSPSLSDLFRSFYVIRAVDNSQPPGFTIGLKDYFPPEKEKISARL